MVAMLRKLRKHLTDNADYVGGKFAEEARRIHYDEVEKRGIYGEATSDEVHALRDEGIEFHPAPDPAGRPQLKRIAERRCALRPSRAFNRPARKPGNLIQRGRSLLRQRT